jgi:hypothetical protein
MIYGFHRLPPDPVGIVACPPAYYSAIDPAVDRMPDDNRAAACPNAASRTTPLAHTVALASVVLKATIPASKNREMIRCFMVIFRDEAAHA